MVLVAGVSAIVFFLVNAIGNPIAMLIAGQPNATEEQINQLTAYYHLDEPAWQRYLHWLGNLAHLDFGTSITYNEPVRDMLLTWGSETLKIQLPAILIAFALAVAIARLLDDGALRERLGAAGRERVISRFTWQITAAGTAACYQALMEGEPLPGAPSAVIEGRETPLTRGAA